jgi:hypothetical protein
LVATTPVVVERAFAHHGVPVSRVSSSPELCDLLACTGLDVWGDGSDKIVYLAPLHGKDFMVLIFQTAAGARRIARFERSNAGLGTAARGSTLLVYLPSSSRIKQLRAALAGIR